MARHQSKKDAQAVAELVQRAKDARARLPEIVLSVEALVRRVDPIELLSQLTVLFQTHPETEQPNRDETARWQVRLEWLTWLVFSRGLTSPPQPEVIDSRILDPLDKLIDEYVVAVTLSARSGDVVAALKDVDKAILQPLAQAQRARDYIAGLDAAEFLEKGTGRRVVVRRADIADVFLVTLVGTGAWSLIAANLVRLAPLGLFADGEYPWALSVNDLSVVADCVEFPSQLFDYLRRRYEAQREPRFRFHDEWDLLGVYMAGALDIRDPRFAGADFVSLDSFDDDLQDYYYSLGGAVATPERPRRPVPENLKELLLAVERARHPQKTDAICVVLSWPNWGLEELGKSLRDVRGKVVLDGKAHAVAVGHPWRASGVSFCCGFRNRRGIQQTLWTACESHRQRTGAQEWAGFGIDLAAPWDPIVFYYRRPSAAQP